MLFDDEQLDDLQYDGLHIIRKRHGFTYGHDAVLLANFFNAKRGERCIDLCAGGGIIALLAAAKTGADFTGVELQPALCDMAARSAALNAQDVRFYCAALNTLPDDTILRESYDAACCNPPYAKGGTPANEPERRLALQGEGADITEVCACAARLLRFGGRFYITYPAALLCPACGALVAAGLQPKRIAFVRAKRASVPYLALIEAKKGAKPGLRYDADIVLEEAQ